MSKYLKNNKGFTLVEVIVVAVIVLNPNISIFYVISIQTP